MDWQVEFYPGVEKEILGMPPKIQARMLRLLEMVETHGANLGPPHTESMGDGLFEIRAKAREGIGRSLFVMYMENILLFSMHSSKKAKKRHVRR
jgi:phage-related protein